MRGVSTNLFFFWSIAVSALLFFLLWYAPLYSLGSIYTATQEPEYSDQNFYIYFSSYYCRSPPGDFQEYNVTWSSAGIVSYLAWTCRITGSDFGYLIFNYVIFTVCFLVAQRSAERSANRRPWVAAYAPFLIPATLYYVGLPGKEILSFCAVLIFFASLLELRRSLTRHFLYLSIALGAAFFNRPHEAIILLALRVGFEVYRRFGFGGVALLALGSSYLIETVIAGVVNPLFDTTISEFSDTLVVTDEGLGRLVISDNMFLHVLLAPVRILYLLLGVFYKSVIAFGAINLSLYSIFRDVPIALRAFDFGFVIYCVLTYRKRDPKVWPPAAFILFGELFFITLFGVEEKSRYVHNIIPMIMIASFFTKGCYSGDRPRI